jgi:hypothetical protein
VGVGVGVEKEKEKEEELAAGSRIKALLRHYCSINAQFRRVYGSIKVLLRRC